jgi:O-antigen/teichoic acid export membrane protein
MAALLAQVPITSTHGVSSVIYPRISEQFGESRDPIRLRSFFSPAITGAAFIAPLLVAVLFVGGRFLLVWLLPAFEESIGPLFLLSYGVYLLCLSPIAAALLMAAGRNHLYLRAEVVALIGAMVAYGVLTLTGELSKMLIAGTASASAFLFSTVLLNHAFRTIALDAKGRVQEIAKLYLPWLLSGIAVAFVHIYLPLDSSQGVWNCFLRTLVSAACYLIVYSPMIYLLEKNTGILNRVVRTVLVRGGKAT